MRCALFEPLGFRYERGLWLMERPRGAESPEPE